MARGKTGGVTVLSGPEKVAVLMISMGETIASKVLAKMNEKEIQAVGNYMSFMENVSNEQIDAVAREFFESLEGGEGGMLSGGREYLKKMLEKTMDAGKVAEILSKIAAPGQTEELGGGLEAIRHLDPKTVATFLRNEYPQTAAIVLAHLDAVQAGEILKNLPDRFRAEIVFRIATLERVNPTVVADLDRALASEFQSAGAMEGSRLGGVEAVAEIVNNLDHNMEVGILTEIESFNPELAENIRQLMFVFEDLLSVDDKGMQVILKEVGRDDLILGLKTASEPLKEKILHNMSKRAGEMLKEDLAAMGPVKLSDVEKAQQNIIRIVKKLEEDGKVVLASGGEELV
ncbi:MAG: flagellar motor switch protein FliG [Nitrospinae bacterium]|nr:flagellar motor switch protein FliG [Nitrospinota bacterium]